MINYNICLWIDEFNNLLTAATGDSFSVLVAFAPLLKEKKILNVYLKKKRYTIEAGTLFSGHSVYSNYFIY